MRLRKAGFDGAKTTWFGELNQPIGRTREVVPGQNSELQHLSREKNSLVLRLVDKGREKPGSVLSFPSEVGDILPSFTIAALEETAQAAELIGFIDKSGRISEEPGAAGAISFRHDNIRDYFATQELRNKKILSDAALAKAYLEHTKWDTALQMYFGLITDEQDLADDLNAVAEFDPCLSTRCLLWSEASTEAHATNLLQFFPIERLAEIPAPRVGDTEYGATSALSRILSFRTPAHLRELYCSSSTHLLIRRAIPPAFEIALGEKAFPHLKELATIPRYAKDWDLLSAISNIGTSESWEFLARRYIDAFMAEDPDSRIFETLVDNERTHPSLKTVKTMLDYARSKLHIPDGEEAVHTVTWCLARPITRMGRSHIDELLPLLQKPNRAIAEAAFEALRNHRHPVIVDGLVDSLKEDELDSSERDTYVDLSILASLRDPEIQAQLWQLFREKFHDFGGTVLSIIPEKLPKKADQETFEATIDLALETDTDLSAESLRILALADPERTLAILRNKASEIRRDTTAWYMLTVGRALCGDTSVKQDLLKVLSVLRNKALKAQRDTTALYDILIGRASCGDISAKQDLPKKFLEIDPPSFQLFHELVFLSIRKLRLTEAQPALRDLVDKLRSGHLRSMGIWQLRYFEHTEGDCRPRLLAETIRKECHNPGHFKVWCTVLDDYVRHWSPATVEAFLRELRDMTERVICGSVDGHAGYLYALSVWLRRQKGRRYLDIFAQWPYFSHGES